MSYYGGGTLFYHSHESAEGTVTHSHPYLPSAGHTHSGAALQLIGHLSSVIFALAVMGVVFYAACRHFVFGVEIFRPVFVAFKADCPLRAP